MKKSFNKKAKQNFSKNRSGDPLKNRPDEYWLIDRDIHAPEIALVFCDTYSAMASSLGFSMLLRAFAKTAEVSRFYYTAAGPVSHDTRKSLSNFRLIVTSIPYEPHIKRFGEMLEKGGVKSQSCDRHELDPIVIGGGIAVPLAPQAADMIMDLALDIEGDRLIGSETSYIDYLAMKCSAFLLENHNNSSRKIFVEELETMALETKMSVPEYSVEPITSAFIAHEAEFSDTLLIEITRGCPMKCGFCFAGHGFDPFRENKLENIFRIMTSVSKDAGFVEFVNAWANNSLKKDKRPGVGLVGAAASVHPHYAEIVRKAESLTLRPALSSISVQSVNILPTEIFKSQRSIALALETVSPDLRKKINKKGSADDFTRAVEKLLSTSISELTIYVIIGIPGEEQRHIKELTDYLLGLKRVAQRANMGLTLSVNPFVPKRNTPMQNEKLISKKEYSEKCRFIKKNLCKNGFRIRTENYKEAQLQVEVSGL